METDPEYTNYNAKVSPIILDAIERSIWSAIARARMHGVEVEVIREPKQPLAMGHYKPRVIFSQARIKATP